jgi:hypothetical protein
MRKSALVLGVFFSGPMCSPSAISQPSHGQATPDFSGSWERIREHVEMFEEIPGFDGPGPMMADPRYPGGTVPGHRLPPVASLDNPILKPATLARLQVITDAELQGMPIIWDEEICAENNRYVGNVTVDGVITTEVPTPTDDTPDF